MEDMTARAKKLEAALNDLVVSVHQYFDLGGSAYDVHVAVGDAIELLPSDPRVIEQDYLVSLEIGFVTTSPEEAVREFVKLVEADGLKAWMYKVTDDDGTEHVLDASYDVFKSNTDRY